MSSPAWGDTVTDISTNFYDENNQPSTPPFWITIRVTCSTNCDCEAQGTTSLENVYYGFLGDGFNGAEKVNLSKARDNDKLIEVRALRHAGNSYYPIYQLWRGSAYASRLCPRIAPPPPSPTLSLSSSPSPMGKPIFYGKEQEPVEVKTLMSNSSGKLSKVVYSDNANVTPIVSSGTVLASGNWVAVSKFEPSVA